MDQRAYIMIYFLSFWWQIWLIIAFLLLCENIFSSISYLIPRTVNAEANGVLLRIVLADKVRDFILLFWLLLRITLFHEIVYIVDFKRLPIIN